MLGGGVERGAGGVRGAAAGVAAVRVADHRGPGEGVGRARGIGGSGAGRRAAPQRRTVAALADGLGLDEALRQRLLTRPGPGAPGLQPGGRYGASAGRRRLRGPGTGVGPLGSARGARGHRQTWWSPGHGRACGWVRERPRPSCRRHARSVVGRARRHLRCGGGWRAQPSAWWVDSAAGVAVVAVTVTAPGLVVDEAAVVVARGGGVVVVVPHVAAAVLVEVGAGVAALTGVDTGRGTAGQTVWPEASSSVQPWRLTVLRVVATSTRTLFNDRLERSSHPGRPRPAPPPCQRPGPLRDGRTHKLVPPDSSAGSDVQADALGADLSQAVLTAPASVSTHPTTFTHNGTAMSQDPPADSSPQPGVSVQGVDAAHPAPTDANLTDCLFSGASPSTRSVWKAVPPLPGPLLAGPAAVCRSYASAVGG